MDSALSGADVILYLELIMAKLIGPLEGSGFTEGLE